MLERSSILTFQVATKNKYNGPEKMATILKEYCPGTNVSVLDCGAGTGIVGEKLHGLGYKNVDGVDISQKSLDCAEQKGVYRKLVCADMEQELPFEEKEFDVIVCSGGICPGHVTPIKCFQEWNRVVKQGEIFLYVIDLLFNLTSSSGGYVIIILRRCYVELQEGEEAYYSQNLGEEFNSAIRKLQESKTWKVILRQTFPAYCYVNGTFSDGILLVCEVC
ncbi:Methyltransferase-like protein 27 [Holothuria leucospilota]|uniref:Methyltransferase-like protein 27 n=1 Tax=Holothuria leucospilota TaxID=206669 RepID=A0A9Q1BUQ2_HOLLE|nr:Methyltransferase-like protein 27 [Holothuria leucospilota]